MAFDAYDSIERNAALSAARRKGKTRAAVLRAIESMTGRVPGMPAEILHTVTRVAVAHNLRVDQLFGKTRLQPIAYARQEAMLRLHDGHLMTKTCIATLFAVNFATVTHAINAQRKRDDENV